MRPKVIAGNWKMNLGPSETRAFAEALDLPGRGGEGTEVILFPPTLSLAALREAIGARPELDGVGVGVQNVHHEEAGAYTGEVSVPMAREAGATYVLVGHSERRHLFRESDDAAGRKVDTVLRHGLVPVLCVGERLEERRAGRLRDVLLRQLDAALEAGEVRRRIAGGARILLAYEPVWAIGTGETATPGDAEEAHAILDERLREAVGEGATEGIPILYGGSVKPANAGELLRAPRVDGVLVGGASLDPASFASIVAAAG